MHRSPTTHRSTTATARRRLFPLESAVLTMQEAELDDRRRQAVEHEHAGRLPEADRSMAVRP